MPSLLIALLAVCAPADKPSQTERPHIVFLLADDLGWKDVGFHGSEIKTPELDALAASGVRLNQFYVQPVCSPTRSSLMTGRYPMRQGLQVGVIRPWASYGLSLEERLLPQVLKEAGYQTAICGKWHLGEFAPEYLPRSRGFDHQYGHYLGAIDYFTHQRNGGLDWHRNGKALREEGYSTNLIGQEAADVIARHDSRRPLFLYVPFNAPHTPLQAPEEYLAKYANIKQPKRRKYAAMVTCLDDAVKRIVTALEKRGMRENTLILFSSDNGGPTRLGANNGPLRAGKGTLYEGGVRVPAFAVWPGKLPRGKTTDALMHIVDWYPTLAKLVGASLESSKKLDGFDMWPAIAADGPSPRKEILHNVTPRDGALRKGDWKLVVHNRQDAAKRKVEVFNLADDPYEKTDLSQDQAKRAREMLVRLREYGQESVPPEGGQGAQPKGFKVPMVWGERDGPTLGQ